MKNQFFYTLEKSDKTTCMGSFNPEYVIRTMQYEGEKLVVMLDDFHPMKTPVRKMNKNGKLIEQIEESTVCSEIWLNEEDSKRYRELTQI